MFLQFGMVKEKAIKRRLFHDTVYLWVYFKKFVKKMEPKNIRFGGKVSACMPAFSITHISTDFVKFLGQYSRLQLYWNAGVVVSWYQWQPMGCNLRAKLS